MPGRSRTAAPAMTAARYSLTIDGVEIGQFSQLGGISSEIEVVDVMEASGNKLVPMRLPGKRKPPTVTLKRGKNQDLGIFAWHQSVVEGQLAASRKGCTLTIYNAGGDPIAKYYLASAWPSKVEISAVKAGAGEVLYEEVTLICEDIQRVAT